MRYGIHWGLAVLLGLCGGIEAAAGEKIRFRKHQLDDKFRSEGVAVADFNRDGRPDVAAGFVWYEAPDWKMHVISPEPPSGGGALIGSPPHYNPQGYSNAFCCFDEDVNGDGWTDLIVVDFPGTPTWWFENPQGEKRPWPKHLVTPVTNNESPDYVKLDDDEQRELIAAFSPDPSQPDGDQRQMAYFTPDADPTAPWHRHPVSQPAAPGTRRYSHGLGAGDVDGDGRRDILTADGWWRAPAAGAAEEWEFHPAGFGERVPGGEGKAAQLYTQDFDGDGDNDVLASSPHGFGIWWHEQLPGGEWKAHEIDSSFSQTHAVVPADINGDGLVDFVTGKRWWAHAKGDPGGDQPAVFYWFELQRRDGRPEWTAHQFDHDSGVGTQFTVADVNQDGLLDVVSSNKKGVHYFEQVRE